MKFFIKIFICYLFVLSCNQVSSKYTDQINNPEILSTEISGHIKFLSADDREGRYPGTKGSQEAIDYIVDELNDSGVLPAGTDKYLQYFSFVKDIKPDGLNEIRFNNKTYNINTDFMPLEFSSNASFSADVAFTGYGFSIKDSVEWDDYKSIDVKDRWVAILMGSPDGDHPHSKYADHLPIRKKAMLAKDNDAKGVLFISKSDSDEFIPLRYDSNSKNMDIPIVQISRKFANDLLNDSLEFFQDEINSDLFPKSFLLNKNIDSKISLKKETIQIPNIIGMIPGNHESHKNEYIVIGAHFDHLGYGGQNSGSLAPDEQSIHNGADDNASGIAGVLEIAEKLKANQFALNRSILFMGYNAEEQGLLGSKYYVNNPTVPLNNIVTMINMDMIGRMSNNKITVGGTGTSSAFDSILNNVEKNHDLLITKSPEGFGPSDHSSFYINDIPVLFFFTGAHNDYHKPSDDWTQINVESEKKILDMIYDIIIEIDQLEIKPPFTEAGPKGPSQSRTSFKVTFGIIPSYSSDAIGLEIDGARQGGPAQQAGMKKGDIIIKIGGKNISNIYDYMYRLSELKSGESVEVTVQRGNKELKLILNL
tara:strand:- start:17 stop:1792 length:1776 start_codon:yes stop_codon:yes gene_type:complete